MKNILEVCLSPDFGGLEVAYARFYKVFGCKSCSNPKGKAKRESLKRKVLSLHNSREIEAL